MSNRDDDETSPRREPYWPKDFPADTASDDPKFKLAEARQFLKMELMDRCDSPGFLVRAFETLVDCKLEVWWAAQT